MNLIEQAALRLEALHRSGLAGQMGSAAPAVPDARSKVQEIVGEAANAPLGRPSALLRRVRAPELRNTTTIDLEGLKRSGHLTSMDQRSLLSEEFRCIKRPLLRNLQQAQPDGIDPGLVMVTSALPGEGKTFCSINLALSLAAEIDLSVLLVDADVVNPQLMPRLGIEPGRGLMELLADPALELADVALNTNVPNLAVLPAGTPNGRSNELLSSAAMRRLLHQLSAEGQGRIVVFDGPPMLLTNEATVLASQVGQVLMVVEATRTPAAAVREAFALVERNPIVFSVLNKGQKPPASAKGYPYYFQGSN